MAYGLKACSCHPLNKSNRVFLDETVVSLQIISPTIDRTCIDVALLYIENVAGLPTIIIEQK